MHLTMAGCTCGRSQDLQNVQLEPVQPLTSNLFITNTASIASGTTDDTGIESSSLSTSPALPTTHSSLQNTRFASFCGNHNIRRDTYKSDATHKEEPPPIPPKTFKNIPPLPPKHTFRFSVRPPKACELRRPNYNTILPPRGAHQCKPINSSLPSNPLCSICTRKGTEVRCNIYHPATEPFGQLPSKDSKPFNSFLNEKPNINTLRFGSIRSTDSHRLWKPNDCTSNFIEKSNNPCLESGHHSTLELDRRKGRLVKTGCSTSISHNDTKSCDLYHTNCKDDCTCRSTETQLPILVDKLVRVPDMSYDLLSPTGSSWGSRCVSVRKEDTKSLVQATNKQLEYRDLNELSCTSINCRSPMYCMDNINQRTGCAVIRWMSDKFRRIFRSSSGRLKSPPNVTSIHQDQSPHSNLLQVDAFLNGTLQPMKENSCTKSVLSFKHSDCKPRSRSTVNTDHARFYKHRRSKSQTAANSTLPPPRIQMPQTTTAISSSNYHSLPITISNHIPINAKHTAPVTPMSLDPDLVKELYRSGSNPNVDRLNRNSPQSGRIHPLPPSRTANTSPFTKQKVASISNDHSDRQNKRPGSALAITSPSCMLSSQTNSCVTVYKCSTCATVHNTAPTTDRDIDSKMQSTIYNCSTNQFRKHNHTVSQSTQGEGDFTACALDDTQLTHAMMQHGMSHLSSTNNPITDVSITDPDTIHLPLTCNTFCSSHNCSLLNSEHVCRIPTCLPSPTEAGKEITSEYPANNNSEKNEQIHHHVHHIHHVHHFHHHHHHLHDCTDCLNNATASCPLSPVNSPVICDRQRPPTTIAAAIANSSLNIVSRTPTTTTILMTTPPITSPSLNQSFIENQSTTLSSCHTYQAYETATNAPTTSKLSGIPSTSNHHHQSTTKSRANSSLVCSTVCCYSCQQKISSPPNLHPIAESSNLTVCDQHSGSNNNNALLMRSNNQQITCPSYSRTLIHDVHSEMNSSYSSSMDSRISASNLNSCIHNHSFPNHTQLTSSSPPQCYDMTTNEENGNNDDNNASGSKTVTTNFVSVITNTITNRTSPTNSMTSVNNQRTVTTNTTTTNNNNTGGGRQRTSNCTSGPNSVSTEIQESRSSFHRSILELRKMGWYWGPLSFQDAQILLAKRPDGTFLVRDSGHDTYILSLSFRVRGQTYHTRIEHNRGRFSFCSQPQSHSASTMVQFIEKAVAHSINGQFHYFVQGSVQGQPPVEVPLLYPLSRFQTVGSLRHLSRFVILSNIRCDHIDQLPLPKSLLKYLSEKQYFTESLEDFEEAIRGRPPLEFRFRSILLNDANTDVLGNNTSPVQTTTSMSASTAVTTSNNQIIVVCNSSDTVAGIVTSATTMSSDGPTHPVISPQSNVIRLNDGGGSDNNSPDW